MAEPRSIACPSCGANHSLHNPGIVMFVCEYCTNVVYWDEEKIRSAGNQAVLPEGFSRLFRGASGRLHQKRFRVLGRARYRFGRGFWDEWFVELDDGKTAWLTEDNHELAIQKVVPFEDERPADSYVPGSSFSFGDREFFVRETGEAECIGLEGDLSKELEIGEKYAYVDASSPDGRYTLGLEFDEGDRPTAYMGEWLQPAELELDDEGLDW